MYEWKILIAILAALIPNLAFAQKPDILNLFRDINTGVPMPEKSIIIAEVMKAAVAIQKRAGGCVASSAEIEKITPATAIPYVIDGILAKRLRNGWTVEAKHQNCGSDISRYLIVETSDRNLETIRTNKGRSYTNESLINDTLAPAYLGAYTVILLAGVKCDKKDSSAENTTLGTTRIANEEPDLGPDVYGVRYAGSWSEVWPITMCGGRTTEVTIRFTADGDGGAYINIRSDKSKLLPATK